MPDVSEFLRSLTSFVRQAMTKLFGEGSPCRRMFVPSRSTFEPGYATRGSHRHVLLAMDASKPRGMFGQRYEATS